MKISKNMIETLKEAGISIDQYCLEPSKESSKSLKKVTDLEPIKRRRKDESVALENIRAMVQEGYSIDQNPEKYIASMDIKHRLKKFVYVFNIGEFLDPGRMYAFASQLLARIDVTNDQVIRSDLIAKIIRQSKRKLFCVNDLMKGIDLLSEKDAIKIDDERETQKHLLSYYETIIASYGL